MILTTMNKDWLQLNEMLPTAKEVLEAYKNVFDGKALLTQMKV